MPPIRRTRNSNRTNPLEDGRQHQEDQNGDLRRRRSTPGTTPSSVPVHSTSLASSSSSSPSVPSSSSLSSSAVTEFTSHTPSESKQIVWRVQNLSTLIKMAKLKVASRPATAALARSTRMDSIKFKLGEGIGFPSKWKFRLCYRSLKEGSDELALWLYFVGGDDGSSGGAFVERAVTLKTPNGATYFRKQQGPGEMKVDRGKGWNTLITMDQLKGASLLVDDCLTLYLDFTIYGKRSMVSSGNRGKVIVDKHAKDEMIRDLGMLLEGGICSDFVIKVPKENEIEYETFRVHRNILAARCPVFKVMIEAPMLEKETGEMIISDMSPLSVKVLLTFIYTGTLPNDLVVAPEDLILAADKYQLPTLKEMCDKNLHQFVTPGNAFDMLKLCKLHSLTNGLKFVTGFIKSNVQNIANLL